MAVDMMNFLKGLLPMSNCEIQFLRDRLAGKTCRPFSFFRGVMPENNYSPAQPCRITVFAGPYRFQEGPCKIDDSFFPREQPARNQIVRATERRAMVPVGK